MKKTVSFLLALVLFLSSFALADYDVKSMSDAELKELISACSAELRARETVPPDWILIYDYRSVQIYQTGAAEISIFGDYLNIPVAVINNNDYPVLISIKDAKINGWEVYSSGCSASANSKKKDDISFSIDAAFVKSIDQIDSISFAWKFINSDDTKDHYQHDSEEYRFW